MKIVLLALGWYLDLIVYMTLSALVRRFVAPDLAWGLFPDLAIFVPLRIVAMQLMTPGQWLVAAALGERDHAAAFVERQWPNLLIGAVLFLEGTKQMVRWTESAQALPVMGVIPQGVAFQGIVGVCVGLVFVLSGGALLRMQPVGKWMGFFALGFTAVSTLLSWQLWDALAATIVVAGRSSQGVAVRAGEVAFMQMLFPEIIVVGVVGAMLVLLLCRSGENLSS